MRLILLFGFVASLLACSNSSTYVAQPQPLQPGRLPTPDIVVKIANLGACTDSADRTLLFNSNYPLTVLVHGRKSSAGRFRSLAQLYAFHGQQAVCYSYDDRDSLIASADKLVFALQQLATVSKNKNISIIGHSMGGLVARKAMENNRPNHWQDSDINIKLITVAAPFAGIENANLCGSRTLNWLSLGIIPGICWGITGDNWFEITSKSNFIQHPEPLLPSVQRYLKVVTNEQNTCRKVDNEGVCIESDYVFELAEQYHPVIDHYSQVINIQVDAGHVEIVGYKHAVPRKLLAILQQENMLSATPPDRQEALQNLLVKLYGVQSHNSSSELNQ